MDKKKLEESKGNAQQFLSNVRAQKEQAKEQLKALENAEQQVIGRIQLLEELTQTDNSVEVVAAEDVVQSKS